MALEERMLVDRHLKIAEEGGRVLIPLLGTPEKDLLDAFNAILVEADMAFRERPLPPMEMIRKMARKWTPSISVSLLPEKWELLGDVLCLRLPPGLSPKEEEGLAKAYAEVLGARSVVDYGPIGGQFREPTARSVWGEGTVTTHLENGVRYKLDALRIMFSSGNIDERIRMAKIPMDGERVVDMFAGIGYFTLPVALYSCPRLVDAYEINPLAYRFLKENVALNGVEGKVRVHNEDNRKCPEGKADRVLMGYIGTTHLFLDKAVSILKNEGGWLHYHETCPEELIPERPVGRLKEAANVRGWSLLEHNVHMIKSYAPGIVHLVVDARVG